MGSLELYYYHTSIIRPGVLGLLNVLDEPASAHS